MKVKEKVEVKSLSRVQLSATPGTVAYHTPLCMGFSRQEYWSGLPLPFPEDLSDPGVERLPHCRHDTKDKSHVISRTPSES